MHSKNKNLGFTFAELIVVVSIIVILSSISILNYSNYLKNQRDTSRLEQLSNIWEWLENYATLKWYYPNPDNATSITYSWYTIFKQWTVWDSVSVAIRLSSKPRDPIYKAYYSYSVSANQKQYEIASVSENTPEIVYIPKVYAEGEFVWYAIVKWNYNKLFVSSGDTWTWVIVAMPSITLWVLNQTEIKNNSSFNSWAFVIDKKSNIPDSYKNSSLKMTWNIYFTPVEIFSWSLSDITTNSWSRNTIITNTRSAYSGTVFTDPTKVAFNTLWQSIFDTQNW